MPALRRETLVGTMGDSTVARGHRAAAGTGACTRGSAPRRSSQPRHRCDDRHNVGAGHAVTAGHILRSKGLVMAQSETTARIAANPAGRPFFFALAGPRRALVDGLDGCLLIRRYARARARA
jgi:hypothetical protein